MHFSAQSSQAVPSVESDLEAALTPGVLSALMRSTWTWDDRALRRDLSGLLVQLDAGRAVSRTDVAHACFAATLRARSLASAAGFVAAVLGPKLIADTGNPFRDQFLAAASDPAMYDRQAAAALAQVHARAVRYLESIAHNVDYPPESSWPALVRRKGQAGLGAAMRAYGNTLSSSSLFASIGLAWQTLGVVGDQAASHAEKLERDAISATFAAAEQSGSWDPALVRTRATPGTDGWLLTGLKQFVPGCAGADLIFTIARSVAGPSLFAVDASAPGLEVTELASMDTTRPLYQVTLAETPAALVGSEGTGGQLLMRAIDLATTALAAEQVGLIEKAVTVLLAHTGDRTPSAAVGARMAEVALDHLAAASLWQRAMAAGADESSVAAAVAHIVCSAACIRVATATAEIAGPSAESAVILRRAISGTLLFGGPALSHERLLDRLGM